MIPLSWTYNRYKQRALVMEGPFIICEVIASEPFIERFLLTHSLQDIVSLGKAKVIPEDLRPFTLANGARNNGNL